MQADPKTGQVTASVDELAVYNMLLVEAVVELLAEKGVLTGQEVKDRVKKLRDETKIQLARPQ